MKRLSAYILIIAMLVQPIWADVYNQIQAVKTYTPPAITGDIASDLTGDSDYLSRIANYNFSDVTGRAKIDAIRLALFGITAGRGNRQFGGTAAIKNIEALTMLVRMFGDDTALIQAVTTANPNANSAQRSAALQDAYFNEAATLGIIAAGEDMSYSAPASRQNIARWLVNAGGLTATVTQNTLYQASDWQQIQAQNVDAAALLLDQRIMSIGADGRFNPNGTLSRAGFASILGEVFDKFADTLGVTSNYAVVIGTKTTTTSDGAQTTLTMRGTDNNVFSVALQSNSNGLSVYKNGQLTSHQALVVGDEINYLVQDKRIAYSVVLDSHSVLDKLIETYQGYDDIAIWQGTVMSNQNEVDNTSTPTVNQRRLRLRLTDGSVVDLVSRDDPARGIDNQYLVRSATAYLAPSSLVVGQALTVYTQGNNILYAETGREAISVLKGNLRFIDLTTTPQQIVLIDNNDQIHILPVSGSANINVNYYRAKLSDLKVGAYATVQLAGGEVVYIAADSYQPAPGYIPPAGKTTFGTISQINDTQFNVLEDDTAYYYDSQTQFYLGESKVAANQLKVGDKVKLYFDDIYSTVPSKISIEGAEQLVAQLIRGQLFSYNQFSDEITVGERYQLINSQWQSQTSAYSDTYKLARDVAIYIGEQKIDKTSFNADYNQRDAYFVVKDNYGRAEVVKIVFKDGFERHYNDVVGDFSNVLNKLELKNNVNISFGEGTIFVQDNRIVDKSVLRDNATVYVLSNQVNGQDSAQIISVLPDIKDIFKTIYAGAVDVVNPYDVRINYFATASGYQWTAVQPLDKTLYISDDTKIYNATTDKWISRELFFNDAYSAEENKDDNGKGLEYQRYYGVFITDGYDNLIALRLRYKELVKNSDIDDSIKAESAISQKLDDILKDTVFTMGTIADNNDDWQRVSLNNSHNYVKYSGEWQANSTATFVELSEAVIIKAGRQIDYSELKLGDTIYVIRYDEDALVAYVEN